MSDEEVDGFSKISATLRIFGPLLKPREVSELLGVEPTQAWEKGAPGYRGRPQPHGMWMLESSAATSATMATHILDLLSKTASSTMVWQGLGDRFECDIFVGAWMDSDNAVFSLEPSLLQEIARRGLVLSADLYFVGSDDSEE